MPLLPHGCRNVSNCSQDRCQLYLDLGSGGGHGPAGHSHEGEDVATKPQVGSFVGSPIHHRTAQHVRKILVTTTIFTQHSLNVPRILANCKASTESTTRPPCKKAHVAMQRVLRSTTPFQNEQLHGLRHAVARPSTWICCDRQGWPCLHMIQCTKIYLTPQRV